MSEDEIAYYKVIIFPYTKLEAQEIKNYFNAFSKNKKVDIEKVKS